MGLLFLVLGLILLAYGIASDPAIYARHSLGHNVNLSCGGFFVLVGCASLWMARNSRRSAP
ncbi:MAG: hypothetical protein WDM96_00390 [Lacunisphaera sp.]